MVCPPVRGDNPRALANGLSPIHVDNHDLPIYITKISVNLAHYEIFSSSVGKGGIKNASMLTNAMGNQTGT